MVSKNLNEYFNNDPGFSNNILSTINPNNSVPKDYKLRNFSFNLEPREVYELYYMFQMPNKSHFFRNDLSFHQTLKYQESRRFGLWLEGIIFGSVLALIIFTFYSYSQIRDKTSLYFGFWLISAAFAVLAQDSHDGARLFEFLIHPIENNPIFNSISI